MEKATIPGALAKALQKRRVIMVVTVSPRAGQTVPPRSCRRSGTWRSPGRRTRSPPAASQRAPGASRPAR